jgi:hypothetical protein
VFLLLVALALRLTLGLKRKLKNGEITSTPKAMSLFPFVSKLADELAPL